jgi:D-alanyl-D-alanine carboxypeptidase/D-alanyl-D-alanine-endopeptidase (penicillin-binding protein 4)
MFNSQKRKFFLSFCIPTSILCILSSCSLQKQISKSASQFVLNDSSLKPAHVGISIYEPAANKYWFNYQADHYFTPASNTKIPTCYAAMKYLGDSLEGVIKLETIQPFSFYQPETQPCFILISKINR